MSTMDSSRSIPGTEITIINEQESIDTVKSLYDFWKSENGSLKVATNDLKQAAGVLGDLFPKGGFTLGPVYAIEPGLDVKNQTQSKGSSLEGTAKEILEILLNIFREVADEAVSIFKERFEQLAGNQGTGVKAQGGKEEKDTGSLAELGNFLNKLSEGFKTLINILQEVNKYLGVPFLGKLVEMLGKGAGIISTVLGKLGLGELLIDIFKKVFVGDDSIRAILMDWFRKLIDNPGETLGKLADSIGEFFEDAGKLIWETIKSWFKKKPEDNEKKEGEAKGKAEQGPVTSPASEGIDAKAAQSIPMIFAETVQMSSSQTDVHISAINIQTQATDAAGISESIQVSLTDKLRFPTIGFRSGVAQ